MLVAAREILKLEYEVLENAGGDETKIDRLAFKEKKHLDTLLFNARQRSGGGLQTHRILRW